MVKGQSTLPASCPVCEHTPVSAADCKPNKSLRTTIKVFLRTEEKKREAFKSKEVKATPPETPVEAVSVLVETPVVAPEVGAPSQYGDVVEKAPTSNKQQEDKAVTVNLAEQNQEAQKDIPQQSIEVSSLIK